MGTIWLLGFIGIIFYRAFWAGGNTEYFARVRSVGTNEDKVVGYVIATISMALTWPLTVPLYCIFIAGKKFRKDA
jgi:hypothetical protein